jgi:hypothetical protein
MPFCYVAPLRLALKKARTDGIEKQRQYYFLRLPIRPKMYTVPNFLGPAGRQGDALDALMTDRGGAAPPWTLKQIRNDGCAARIPLSRE